MLYVLHEDIYTPYCPHSRSPPTDREPFLGSIRKVDFKSSLPFLSLPTWPHSSHLDSPPESTHYLDLDPHVPITNTLSTHPLESSGKYSCSQSRSPTCEPVLKSSLCVDLVLHLSPSGTLGPLAASTQACTIPLGPDPSQVANILKLQKRFALL